MYHQSTAPRSRSARLQDAAVVALIILGLGAWAGTAAYDVATAPPVVPTPAAPVATAAPRGWAIGDYAEFDARTVVWVDATGLWAYTRADANHDSKGTSAALGLWDHFVIPPGTLLKITNRERDVLQVELVDGPLAGRRGWTEFGTLLRRR